MTRIDLLLTRMQGKRVYFDANYLIYFFDANPTYFDVVAPFFIACGRGEFKGMTGEIAVAEVLVHPYKSKNPAEITCGKEFFARDKFLKILGHNATIFDTAAQVRANSNIKLIDAIHYATALNAGCDFMLTNDRDFKETDLLVIVPISSLLLKTDLH
jgi:predicted nucleic acid-binding protein